jgi:hypothetical protein
MPWVVVVDGNPDQLRIIRRLAKRFGVKVILVLDFIHVTGYVWKAAHAFHEDRGRGTGSATAQARRRRSLDQGSRRAEKLLCDLACSREESSL